MKPVQGGDILEEIVEVHSAGKSPSPKRRSKSRSRSRSGSRRLSNGHQGEDGNQQTNATGEDIPEKSKTRDNWLNSEQESVELPIHDQIKQGILGFVEKEIKKSDGTKPSFVFYSHDPNGLDEKYMKTLSRPSSGHKEKRSPSYKRKKRHSSKYQDPDVLEFDVPGSSLSALERVDDYLKEYNKDEVVTLSGELDIETNGVNNNNEIKRESHHKQKKMRKKIRDERQGASNGRDVSPKVFKTATKSKLGGKPARPKDLAMMLESLDSSSRTYDQYIDNPFSSPSPLTSPNDERLDPFKARRGEKVYLQGGGTFRAVSSDRILSGSQQTNNNDEGDKFVRFGDTSSLDIAMMFQKGWRTFAPACHGVLGGLSLMHLLLISNSDGLDATHLSFHSVVTMPYVAAYYFFCTLCVVSVLDRLDAPSIDISNGLQPYFRPIVLVILYTACLLVCNAARFYDELIVFEFNSFGNATSGNGTTNLIPSFYHTWTHFSIWRAVLAIMGLIYFVISNPQDLVYLNLSKLVQYNHPLQSIG